MRPLREIRVGGTCAGEAVADGNGQADKTGKCVTQRSGGALYPYPKLCVVCVYPLAAYCASHSIFIVLFRSLDFMLPLLSFLLLLVRSWVQRQLIFYAQLAQLSVLRVFQYEVPIPYLCSYYLLAINIFLRLVQVN